MLLQARMAQELSITGILELLGTAGEFEGVVAHRGLGAQPEGVELRQPLDGRGAGSRPGSWAAAAWMKRSSARASLLARPSPLIHQDGELSAAPPVPRPRTGQGLGVLQHQRLLARAQRQRRQALLLAHRPAVGGPRLRVSSCSGSWLRP